MNVQTMINITYGLEVLTTEVDGKYYGCIINTASQITSDPVVMSIAVNKANYTCGMIQKSKKFTVSILSEQATFDVVQHFGFQSGKDIDKFADFKDYAIGLNGVPVVTKGTNSFISADVIQELDMGTHILFIAKVTDAENLNDIPSASYAYYHKHIKPQPQAAASGKELWVCNICGFIYDKEIGDAQSNIGAGIAFEDLPADYVCPLCKHPKSDFSKMESNSQDDGNGIYVCEVCGFVYDPEVGCVEEGIDAGTSWSDVPNDFSCPLCGMGKGSFKAQ